MRSLHKLRALALFCLLPLLLCACAGPDGSESSETEPSTEPSFDYSAALAAYGALPGEVETTLSCALPVEIRIGYHIIPDGEGGYTAAPLQEGESLSCTAGQAEAFLRQACYLPPYDTEVTGEDGRYTAELSGDGVCTFLLSGNPLFTGYEESGAATLAAPCVYTVYAQDGKILSYSYSFTLSVTDGAETLCPDICYTIEVKE